MINSYLYEKAVAFRKAIEKVIESGELTEINMKRFPKGCCSYASDLLQRYFTELGIRTYYMSGQYGNGWDAENHAWLETQNGTVIDITGDQYKDKALRFSIPVYVGTRNDGFHDRFVLDDPVEYHAGDETSVRDRELDKQYEIIMRCLR